jgi:hypothetical protein
LQFWIEEDGRDSLVSIQTNPMPAVAAVVEERAGRADPAVPIREKCGQYLDRSGEELDGCLRTLLSTLSNRLGGDAMAAAFASCDRGSARENIREYFSAIWELGETLTADGLLPGAQYQRPDLEEYVALLEQLPEGALEQVYAQVIHCPLEVLRAVGSASPRELFDQAAERFSPILPVYPQVLTPSPQAVS